VQTKNNHTKDRINILFFFCSKNGFSIGNITEVRVDYCAVLSLLLLVVPVLEILHVSRVVIMTSEQIPAKERRHAAN